jgi:membrane fusion protein, macrolide-specific efflux system
MKRTLRNSFLVVTLLVTGCFLFPKEEEKLAPPLMAPPKVTYETYEAKRTSIVSDFRINGVFTYTKQENLYFRFGGGRLLKMYVASGERVRSGQLLAELDSDTLKYNVSLQEIALQKVRLVAERAALLGRDKYEQQLAALDVKEAELTLANDKAELAKAQLFSPMDGIVDYVGNFSEGDAIDAYRTVIRVADPRVIELSYQGERASDFTFGMNVEVTYRQRTFTGTVVRATSTAPADVSDAEKGAVFVHVKGLPGDVQTAEAAIIRVVVQRRDNVIVIPRNLVQSYQGANYVDLLKDGIRRQQPVEQGIVTTTEAEIVKGLSPGDQVIVR